MAAVVIGVGAIVLVNLCKLAKKINPPEQPPSTPPCGTNAPPATNHVQLSEQSVGSVPVLQFDDSGVYAADISDYGFTDPDGYVYGDIYDFKLLSSTNLKDWNEECTVTGWVSPQWVVSVAYTNNTPASTNWLRRAQGTQAAFNMPIQPAPAKFFQVVSP